MAIMVMFLNNLPAFYGTFVSVYLYLLLHFLVTRNTVVIVFVHLLNRLFFLRVVAFKIFPSIARGCKLLPPLFNRPDINECEDYVCDERTSHSCVNLDGSYKCECKQGYAFDSRQCRGIGIMFCFSSWKNNCVLTIRGPTIGLLKENLDGKWLFWDIFTALYSYTVCCIFFKNKGLK